MKRFLNPRGRLIKGIQGFTLVELLIVMAILSILAGIAVPLYLGQRTKAAHNEAKVNLDAIRLLQEQYYAEASEYAPSGETTSGTLTDVAQIMGNLPSFKPGNLSQLKFNYKIDYTVTSGVTNKFTAIATGKTGSLVDGAVFDINEENEKGW